MPRVNKIISQQNLAANQMAENHEKMISNRQQTKQSLLKERARLRKTVADLEKKLQTKSARENNTLNHKQKLLSDFASFAIESLSDGAFLISKDASLVYVNRAACKQLGYTEEELLGMRVMDFNPHLTQEIWDSVWGVTVRDKIQTIEVEHLTKDGRLVPFEVLANYIELYGEQYSCSFTRDITERKRAETNLLESEERFRALTEGTSDWIWELNQFFVFTYTSPKVKDLLGYEPNEIIGKTPFDLMPEHEAKRVSEIAHSVMESHKPLTSLENINLHKDGHEVIIETSGVPIFDKNGEFSGYRGIDRDITERKKAEESLKYSEQELIKRVKELEEFYEMAVGRELRMKQLKNEIEKLTEKLEKYRNQ